MTAPAPRRRPLTRRIVRLHRAVLARRRLLAAVCAALAVAAALQANAAPPPARVAVLTAARDLPPGARLGADDVVPAEFSPASVPTGVLSRAEAVGRTTVGPVRAGEPLTDVRLLDDGLLAGYPGAVVAPVRIGDGASVRLLRAGDRVTILAADPQGSGPASVVAESVPVVAVPPAAENGPAGAAGALLVVAVDPATARDLAGAGVRAFLSLVLVR